jgi:hypothetical protein
MVEGDGSDVLETWCLGVSFIRTFPVSQRLVRFERNIEDSETRKLSNTIKTAFASPAQWYADNWTSRSSADRVQVFIFGFNFPETSLVKVLACTRACMPESNKTSAFP